MLCGVVRSVGRRKVDESRKRWIENQWYGIKTLAIRVLQITEFGFFSK